MSEKVTKHRSTKSGSKSEKITKHKSDKSGSKSEKITKRKSEKSRNHIKYEDEENDEQFCTGCKIEHPVSSFRFRSNGTLRKQCRDYDKAVAEDKEYVYSTTKKCEGQCNELLPIKKFRILSIKSGKRATRCDKCIPQFAYPSFRKCIGPCGKNLPIENFNFKSKKTGQRQARCGPCIYASRMEKKSTQK